jgi:hypothetical protein
LCIKYLFNDIVSHHHLCPNGRAKEEVRGFFIHESGEQAACWVVMVLSLVTTSYQQHAKFLKIQKKIHEVSKENEFTIQK